MQTEHTHPRRRRIISLDIMAAVIMILVIIGHHGKALSAEWYASLHGYIYSFHMCVFICISGFLIAYTSKNDALHVEYRRSIKKAFKFISLILCFGTLAILAEGYLQKQATSLTFWKTNLELLLLYPRLAPAQFLWYIYMLTWMYLLYPILKRVPTIGLMVLGGFLIWGYYELHPSHFLVLNDFFLYGPFYLLGIIACRKIDVLRGIRMRYWVVASLPFVLYSVLFATSENGFLQVPYIISGIIALPFWTCFAVFCSKVSTLHKITSPIARNLLPLYLIQMFCIKALYILIYSKLNISEFYAIYVLSSSIITIVLITATADLYTRMMHWLRSGQQNKQHQS